MRVLPKYANHMQNIWKWSHGVLSYYIPDREFFGIADKSLVHHMGGV